MSFNEVVVLLFAIAFCGVMAPRSGGRGGSNSHNPARTKPPAPKGPPRAP
jgi:hypothetical protein